MKIIYVFALLVVSATTFAQVTYTSTGAASDWTDPAAWTTPGTDSDGDGYPDSNDNVLIVTGHSITVNSDEAASSIQMNDVGSVTNLTIFSSRTLTVGGNFTMDVGIEEATTNLVVNGTLIVGGSFQAMADEIVSATNIVIGSSGSLDINGTGSSYVYQRDTESGSDFANAGSITCAGSFEIHVTGTSNQVVSNSGTFQTDRDFQLTSEGTGCSVNFQNSGTLDVDTDIEFTTNTGATASSCVLNNKFTGSATYLNGTITMIGSGGTIDASSLVSDFYYDASTSQNIIGHADVYYHNLHITNGSDATMSGNITSGHCFGNFVLPASNSLVMDGATITLDGDVENSGTISMDGTITVGGDFNTNSGGLTSAGALADITGDFNNAGTWTSSGANINVGGNWANTGTYTTATGDVVTMNGTSGTALMSGTNVMSNLSIDHSGSGVTNTGTIVIEDVLDIDDGLFNTGNAVTLKSDATKTAQLMDMTGGDITGTVKVQRFLDIAQDGWREMTSPVAGTFLTDWMDDNLVTSGFPNSDFPGFTFISVQTYYENDANGVKDDGYRDATDALTHSTAPTKGTRFYVGLGTYNMKVTGAPYKGTQTFTIDYEDDTPDADHKGWNLIGNPYACTIDWDNLAASDRTNMENKIWTWSAANGNFGLYVGGAGGPGSNGVSQYIASSQGFWVHATSTGSVLTLNEDDKTTVDPAFVKSNNNTPTLHIRVTSDVNSFGDEVMLTTNPQATAAYDEGLDVKKFFTMPDYVDVAPSLSFLSDGENLTYNVIPGKGNRTLPLDVQVGVKAHGTYHLDFSQVELFMPGSCLLLEDRVTGELIDVRATERYTYTSSMDVKGARFVLHIMTEDDAGKNCELSVQAYTGSKSLDGVSTDFLETKIMRNALQINYGFDKTKAMEVQVFDLLGKQVLPSKRANAAEGTLNLNTAGLSGTYILRITHGNEVHTEKVSMNL